MQTSLFTPVQMAPFRHQKLPKIYKDFYNACAVSKPKRIQFCETRNDNPWLQEKAYSILRRNNASGVIGNQQFVFLIVNDCSLFFFDLDGNENPVVKFWSERSNRITEIEDLKSILTSLRF